MKYKESMFNAEVREDPWTYLYNSLEGTGSLVKIDSGKLSHIRENVRQNGYDGSPEFEKLLSKRFFCQADVDEKDLAEVRYMDTVEERTLRFIILPTEKCNFRCLYCYEDFKIGKMSLEVQDDIIEFVKRNVSDFTGVDIRWFGGEPLLAIGCHRTGFKCGYRDLQKNETALYCIHHNECLSVRETLNN